MYNIIDFLNHNSGAITVLLTLVLAFINIYQWRLAHKLRHDANRPKVLANVDGVDGFVYYKLVNYGSSSALEVKVKIDSQILNTQQYTTRQRNKLEALGHGSFSLLPGGVIYVPTYCLWLDIKDKPLKLSYTYKDMSGKKYSEEYAFNLSVLDIFAYRDHNERADNELKKDIRNALNTIAKKIEC